MAGQDLAKQLPKRQGPGWVTLLAFSSLLLVAEPRQLNERPEKGQVREALPRKAVPLLTRLTADGYQPQNPAGRATKPPEEEPPQ
jgi:hypothetical protein